MLSGNQPTHPILSRVTCPPDNRILGRTPATALLALDDESRMNGVAALDLDNEDENNDLDLKWDAILRQVGLGPDIWRSPTWMKET